MRIFKDFHLHRARACSDARLLEELARVGEYLARPMTHQDNLAPVIMSIFINIKKYQGNYYHHQDQHQQLGKVSDPPEQPSTCNETSPPSRWHLHIHTFRQRLYWRLILFLSRGHIVIFQNIFKQHLNICQDRAILRSIQEHLIRSTK